MSSTQSFDWIRQINHQLAELDQKPQFGTPSSFDQGRFEHDLQALFNRADVSVKTEPKGWVHARQVLEGLGLNLTINIVQWQPLHAAAFFVTDQATLKELMATLFVSEKDAGGFYDQQLVEGFSTYLGAEILRLISQQEFGSPLKPRLGARIEDISILIGEEACFVTDVALKIGKQTFWGRILLPESFRNQWKSYFMAQGPREMSDEKKRNFFVDMGLEVGRTHLGWKEWKKVKKGDFILLDHCSYDPEEKAGAVLLTLNQKPLLRGRLKEGSVKITNYPVYEEVAETMSERSFNPSQDSEDEDLYGDDEELDLDEEILDNGALSETENLSQEKRPISPEEIPVDLIVEVGRVRMSAAALMDLSPGNLVELNVAPEQGVSLIVNGKNVGRGELIRMGDVLGVRILSL